MTIDVAKDRCEQFSKSKVVKGTYFKGYYVFEVEGPSLSTPFYAIDAAGKIASFDPTSDLDGFFNAWDNAKVYIEKEYPEIID